MTDPLDTTGRESLSVREVAERFIELFHRQNRVGDAFRTWVHPDYIQHNPNAPTGRDATLAMMEAAVAANPGLTHDVKRVIHGDADLVAVHFHFRRSPEDRGAAAIDILRIANGWVVEHWDVVQPVPDPAECRNDNSMF